MHSVEIRDLDLSFGAIEVLKGLNLNIEDGEFLVLLGSSGCGKSTLLNCIAGLLEVTDGQIFIKDRNVTWEEPSDRGIGMVFQSYALYPQMTVEGNLSFGLKNAQMSKDEIAKRVARAAEILQIEPLLKRKPAALSGGQRQRVAIGRALVRDADVFLFDEPLSNLDAKLRADLRVEIKRLHQQLKNTIIYVTHDQVEALTLADRIAVMKGGQIQQLASPTEIYNRPGNRYVADFVGSPAMNFIEGLLIEDRFEARDQVLSIGDYPFAKQPGGPATMGIRPEHVTTGAAAEALSFNTDVPVEVIEPMGSDTLAWTRLADEPFRVRLDGQTSIQPGDRLKIGIDLSKASFFDAETEVRL